MSSEEQELELQEPALKECARTTARTTTFRLVERDARVENNNLQLLDWDALNEGIADSFYTPLRVLVMKIEAFLSYVPKYSIAFHYWCVIIVKINKQVNNFA